MKKILLITALLATAFSFSQTNTYVDTTRFVANNGKLYKIKIYRVVRIDTTMVDSLGVVNELNTIDVQIQGKDLMMENFVKERAVLNRKSNKLFNEAKKVWKF